MLVLLVIFITRYFSGNGAFNPEGEIAFGAEWGGWRIPFACSGILLASNSANLPPS
jgi:hypothetical protein